MPKITEDPNPPDLSKAKPMDTIRRADDLGYADKAQGWYDQITETMKLSTDHRTCMKLLGMIRLYGGFKYDSGYRRALQDGPIREDTGR